MAAPRLTPAQQRQLAIGAGSVVLLVLWVGFLILPQRRALVETAAQVRTLKTQLAETREGMARLPAMEAEAAELATQYEVPVATRPPEEQVPELLKVIMGLARTAQVGLVTVKPTTDLGQLSPGPSGYLELAIEIAAVGGYHELGSFLDALERSPALLVRVARFQVQGNSEDVWHHQAVLTLQAYLLSGRPTSQ